MLRKVQQRSWRLRLLTLLLLLLLLRASCLCPLCCAGVPMPQWSCCGCQMP
jgi:hypothetical protein